MDDGNFDGNFDGNLMGIFDGGFNDCLSFIQGFGTDCFCLVSQLARCLVYFHADLIQLQASVNMFVLVC